MQSFRDLGRHFGQTIVPTGTQVVTALILAVVGLAIAHASHILSGLGITDAAIASTRHQWAGRFDVILQSSILNHVALVTFWAAIGLIAYLVCWGAYNIMVEARNQVTIETQYTNRGHWGGVLETLSLKAVAALALLAYVATFQYGISLWLALSGSFVAAPSLDSSLLAGIAVLGGAVQLYGLLVLMQLTLTPWYHSGAFTDRQK